MSDVPFIPPTPEQIYAILPYQYPLVDEQPVVRIPVKGPEPFNMLAVVRACVPVSTYRPALGTLQDRTLTVATKLRHRDFNLARPDVVFDVVHSSTATLHVIEISDELSFPDDGNTEFQVAVDAVHAQSRFDDSGRWCVTVDVADQWTDVYSAAIAEISSWVLFREHTAATPHSPFGPVVER